MFFRTKKCNTLKKFRKRKEYFFALYPSLEMNKKGVYFVGKGFLVKGILLIKLINFFKIFSAKKFIQIKFLDFVLIDIIAINFKISLTFNVNVCR